MRRVAASAPAEPAARSGWCSRASFRQAALIVAAEASRGTPSTSWGSRLGTRSVYRGVLDSPGSLASPVLEMTPRFSRRRAMAAAIVAAPLAGAWRFALAYRARAGFPKPRPPVHDPGDLGLAFETTSVPSDGLELPAWWIPARSGSPGPAVVLVHGWESARDRTLPNALVLHAAGFHVLTFDVRGHGANPRETLPLTAGEFGADAVSAVRSALERPDVTSVGLLGHSMGGAGALLAAAAEPL